MCFWSMWNISARLSRRLRIAVSPEVIARMITLITVTAPTQEPRKYLVISLSTLVGLSAIICGKRL